MDDKKLNISTSLEPLDLTCPLVSPPSVPQSTYCSLSSTPSSTLSSLNSPSSSSSTHVQPTPSVQSVATNTVKALSFSIDVILGTCTNSLKPQSALVSNQAPTEPPQPLNVDNVSPNDATLTMHSPTPPEPLEIDIDKLEAAEDVSEARAISPVSLELISSSGDSSEQSSSSEESTKSLESSSDESLSSDAPPDNMGSFSGLFAACDIEEAAIQKPKRKRVRMRLPEVESWEGKYDMEINPIVEQHVFHEPPQKKKKRRPIRITLFRSPIKHPRIQALGSRKRVRLNLEEPAVEERQKKRRRRVAIPGTRVNLRTRPTEIVPVEEEKKDEEVAPVEEEQQMERPILRIPTAGGRIVNLRLSNS